MGRVARVTPLPAQVTPLPGSPLDAAVSAPVPAVSFPAPRSVDFNRGPVIGQTPGTNGLLPKTARKQIPCISSFCVSFCPFVFLLRRKKTVTFCRGKTSTMQPPGAETRDNGAQTVHLRRGKNCTTRTRREMCLRVPTRA